MMKGSMNMKNKILYGVILCGLLSVMNNVFAGESQVIDIYVQLDKLTEGALLYVSKEDVDLCKKFGMKCYYNTPFLVLRGTLGVNALSTRGAALQSSIGSFTQQKTMDNAIDQYSDDVKKAAEIQNLPFTLFQKKGPGDELGFMDVDGQKYRLLFAKQGAKDRFQQLLQVLLNNFKQRPRYRDGTLQWLLEQGILKNKKFNSTDCGKEHGPNGYFINGNYIFPTPEELKEEYYVIRPLRRLMYGVGFFVVLGSTLFMLLCKKFCFTN